MSDRGKLCIFDDVINEVSSNSVVSKLFTCGRSHLGCSLVLMLQNIFPKGAISISAQYQFLLHNPRDSLQISILLDNFVHVIVKTFSKFTKEQQVARMDTYFVVLLSLVQTKPATAQTFYRVNIHQLFINFNVTRL